MRSKEEDVDYRFMPEPDLPMLVLDDDLVRNSSIRPGKGRLCRRGTALPCNAQVSRCKQRLAATPLPQAQVRRLVSNHGR